MFWSKDNIVERLSKIPRTLEDISIEIFEGVPSTNDFLHKVSFSREDCTDAPYVCRNLLRNVNIEQELMYPYMDGALSSEFAIHSAQYRFMLPYEILGQDIRKEYRIFQPEEMKTRFPMAYKRLMEIKYKFRTDGEGLYSADCYRLKDESFLHYINTPKIIITDHYRLQASYDSAGNHVFAEGIGVVLGDPTLYHYVTAALNSSISRVFPEIWNLGKVRNNNNLYPKILKRFPITFPESEVTENLINTISRYLIYLNRQKYTAKVYSLPDYQKLIDFYKRISDLLILDTYITNDLDPKFIEILAESITSSEEEFEYSNDMYLLIALQEIKKNILSTPDFRKCKFNNEFTNILATLKNNGVW
ncbi:MAG: hypothetical protein AB9861_11090 [Methanosarcina sp.]|jgi:hypothetical protein